MYFNEVDCLMKTFIKAIAVIIIPVIRDGALETCGTVRLTMILITGRGPQNEK